MGKLYHGLAGKGKGDGTIKPVVLPAGYSFTAGFACDTIHLNNDFRDYRFNPDCQRDGQPLYEQFDVNT
ncbi:MAG: hypothetical protein JXA42_18825 [Anaerolineales bacterium]|nr:hypothetical protein [Anaerolineales bacterium]